MPQARLIVHRPAAIYVTRFLIAFGLCWLILPGRGEAQETSPATARNSTAKIRTKLSKQSKRIGSAVDWQPNFEAAMAKSKETDKPIFWYVPTLRGTFMDRKPEIDRYMMAGPFSWPDIIAVINEHYIPVKAAPTPEQQKKYNLVPYEFVEPGFLILQPSGESTRRVDRITTSHPSWFRGLLTRSLLQPIPVNQKPEVLVGAWELFQDRKYDETLKHLVEAKSAIADLSKSEQSECSLLEGMALFRSGQHEQAAQVWKLTADRFVDEPLAWKAAAELQRVGPFVRGFEVHVPIPKEAMNAGVESAGSAAPRNTYSDRQLWESSVQFLLGMQGADGSFTDSDYDFGGTDSLPNVHVAVTSLVGMALLEAHRQDSLADATKVKIVDAINRAISYVVDESSIAKSDRDEILWAYAYRLRFLNRCQAQNEIQLDMSAEDLKLAIATATKALESVQSNRGGWYHEYSNPFVTATALVALKEAQQTEAPVDLEKIKRGVESLSRDRHANGAYPYSSRRGNRANPAQGTMQDIAASAGRMPICELALWEWNQAPDSALEAAISRSFDLHGNLNSALKYDDHTSNLAYGGFFFWYDMRGRSEAIGKIKNDELRTKFKAQQKALILALPELDGCFVDSHELGRVYGTAMALLSLAKCQ